MTICVVMDIVFPKWSNGCSSGARMPYKAMARNVERRMVTIYGRYVLEASCYFRWFMYKRVLLRVVFIYKT